MRHNFILNTLLCDLCSDKGSLRPSQGLGVISSMTAAAGDWLWAGQTVKNEFCNLP